MKDLVVAVMRAGRFTPTATYQRFAYACAALLVVSGLFHLGVYVVDGGPWEGPVSWRKPVVFGLSFGIAVATITWFMTFLRPHRVVGWVVLGLYSLAAIGEVFLISMQRWRGVPSHFNESTLFNEMVFSYMGMLVTLIGALTVAVAIWVWFRLDAPASLALAIRLGLVLMLVSQVVGIQMIAEGGNTFGAAGAMKLPHAVTLHAAQVLPALALLLLAAPGKELSRVRTVELGVAGYVAVTGATLVQTYAGRAPTDLDLATFALALAGLLTLVACFAVALYRFVESPERVGPAPGRHAGASTP
jgi:hypothetical protein